MGCLSTFLLGEVSVGEEAIIMARGEKEDRERELVEEDLSEEDRNPRHKKSSWSDLVGGGQQQCQGTRASSSRLFGDHSEGQNRGASSVRRHESPATRSNEPKPTREHSERLYTKQEVMELLKSNRSQEEGELDEGWSPVISRASKKKAVMHVREQLGISKKKRKVACWECLETDYISSDCPKGGTCLYCHKQGHLIANCPRKEPKAPNRRRSKERNPVKHADGTKEDGIPKVFMSISDEMHASKIELQKTVGIRHDRRHQGD